MQLIGFSSNLITLFAMVLAIGIVVDDAIVVVEAIHLEMEQNKKLSVLQAAEIAMKRISGAIIAITLVMSAVFIPASFLPGPTGIFYRQFSLTMAISIVISGVVALTLTPALCTLILKNTHGQHKKSFLQKFFNGFNKKYEGLSNRYKKLLTLIVNRRVITFGIIITFVVCSGLLGKILPSGFIPNEDQGTFYISVTTPPGSTLERTKEVIDEIKLMSDGIPALESISTLAGTNILSDGTGASYGTCLVNLKKWDDRKESVDDIMKLMQERTQHIKSAKLEFFPPPAVPGYGNASGFEMRLLDKTGKDDVKEMETVVKKFIEDLDKRPEIGSAFTIFDASYPQLLLKIDEDLAAQKGITINNIMSTLQTLLGSEYGSNFIRFGKMYKVMVQASPEYRAQPSDLLKLYVKNNKDEMVPLSAFTTLEKKYGVDQVTRYNMFPSAELNGEAKKGYSSGQAINAIKEVAATKLPKGYDIDWAGITRDEVSAGNEPIFIFMICLTFVYLILAGQYESFLLPLPVILSLPIGVFGAFFSLWIFGLENNIYVQIAMIMLIGLLGKNAILIIEYASIKHSEGLRPLQAAIEAATLRLRPILMTSFAFIAGLIPLVFATGAGSISNRTIGSAAAGGMLVGTLFGVIVVPGLYYVFATLNEKFYRSGRKEEVPFTEII